MSWLLQSTTCHDLPPIGQSGAPALEKRFQDAGHVSRGLIGFVDDQGVAESHGPDQGRVFVNDHAVFDGGLDRQALNSGISGEKKEV